MGGRVKVKTCGHLSPAVFFSRSNATSHPFQSPLFLFLEITKWSYDQAKKILSN